MINICIALYKVTQRVHRIHFRKKIFLIINFIQYYRLFSFFCVSAETFSYSQESTIVKNQLLLNVNPLLKKPNLDIEQILNHRPVSYLSYML